MKVTVLAFGIAKEIFGGQQAEIDLPDDKTTANVFKTLLEQKYPRLKQLSSFMLAINNEYAHGEEVIGERDDIAVIPPVSGG